MPSRSEVAPRHPAHLSRTRHPAPWSRSPTRQIEPSPTSRSAKPAPVPVFVDDSGRRRRVGRLIGACVGLLVLGYVAVAALTFAGAPLVGRLSPPGLAQLSRPAGDEGLGVGPGAQESPLPPAAGLPADPGAGSPPAERSAGADGTVEQAAPSSTTTAPASTSTTLAPPGQGATTSVPTPNSTMPEHTQPTGGQPAEPPGKP